MGGRGSGKTRAGAEWTSGMANGFPPFADAPVSPIALVSDSFAAVREVMIDGPAGICSLTGSPRPHYEVSRKRLVWPNGAIALAISADDPESLRGPQFAAAWCDEIGKWRNDRATWDMLQFGLRLGTAPRQLVTTTPRPTALLREIIAADDTITVRMRTSDNAANLSRAFLKAVDERYGGTLLGRQELDGEMISERAGALWQRVLLERCRGAPPGDLVRIVVAVDPPATSKATSDACGIVVAGLDGNGIGWVLGDHSIKAAKPVAWASRVSAAYEAAGADCVIAEVNQGGDMVTEVLQSVAPNLPVRTVRATRSKRVRAEPVAALYEQGRVRHSHHMPELEDEMCDFAVDGLTHGRSPDRMDALVWALTALMLNGPTNPRIRNLT